jgi:cobalt-zinc-cadmium efflux system membrane fusion protein
MSQSDSKDGQHNADSGRISMRRATVVALILLAAALATGGYRLILNPSGGPARAQAPEKREAAPYITEGSRIIVPPDSPVRKKLTVEAVGEKEIQRTLALPAMVEADPARTVRVLTPVTGRVTELKVHLGDRVTQGQELAVIDSGDLAQAYSDDEKAHATVKLTKQALDRLLLLEKTSAAAVKDRESAQNDYAQAVSELARAESRLRSIGVEVHPKEGGSRLLTLKTPVAGSIIDLQMAPGAFLNDPNAALITIANLDTIWVTANVPERDTALVAKGQSADVVFTAYPNEAFKGDVLFVSDVLDPDTRRTRVRVAFENPDTRLKPNMFANATFLAPKQNMLVLPTTAVMLKDESDRVFVEVAPWTFEARPVVVGFQQDDLAVIASGLKPGERVVVKGGVLLND